MMVTQLLPVSRIHSVNALFFLIVMYRCEIWTIKKKKIWTLKNWCLWTVALEKTLESPRDAGRPNQSILKEINTEYSLEGLMLKLKLQYYGHMAYWKNPWCLETLKSGREGDNKGPDGWMSTPIQWTWVWANSGRWWRAGKPGVL